MRFIEKLKYRFLASRLNGAYKRAFKVDDAELILRDIVGFSFLGVYDPEKPYTAEQLIELRGRQQMAMHMLRHLDIDAEKMIQYQNDSQQQASYLTEE